MNTRGMFLVLVAMVVLITPSKARVFPPMPPLVPIIPISHEMVVHEEDLPQLFDDQVIFDLGKYDEFVHLFDNSISPSNAPAPTPVPEPAHKHKHNHKHHHKHEDEDHHHKHEHGDHHHKHEHKDHVLAPSIPTSSHNAHNEPHVLAPSIPTSAPALAPFIMH
ncbi:hypothetical protein L2E82_34202 [Cichorium intybus]|uniref:Uncharacterized protein n=1 Tax=Cichorium intybus TaxID=13427 RepID=A0ACB9BLQ5_CICIN|nr:hypothetical protein L2E82_34202 [Cichorium intybus]